MLQGAQFGQKNVFAKIYVAYLNRPWKQVAWNFKHITNIRAMKAVEQVNAEQGYKRLEIYSPQSLIEFSEDEDDE
jgi:hypothetical protein